jgi:hypothetical protein
MSDSLEVYIRKINAMFDKADKQIDQTVKIWRLKIITRLILNTPGPGNQYSGTDYIAVGRLRAGWQFGFEAPASTPLMGDTGEEDITGATTVSRLAVEMGASGIVASSYVWNSVGYGWYVHEGLESHSHIGPRKWVYEVADVSDVLLDEARKEAGAMS